jgi:hypothetical protein
MLYANLNFLGKYLFVVFNTFFLFEAKLVRNGPKKENYFYRYVLYILNKVKTIVT